jgi:hypothetical protein
MSPPVQQRRLKRSDFNERTAVPNPTATAALLGFFEVRFARKVPGGLVDQRLISWPRAHSSRRARRVLVADQSDHSPDPKTDFACYPPNANAP